MSDRAQRVLNALMDYDADQGLGYPIISIIEFFDDENSTPVDEDYEVLTAEEESQVIEAFLDFQYLNGDD